MLQKDPCCPGTVAALGDAMALICLMLCLRRVLDASLLASLGPNKDFWLRVAAGASAGCFKLIPAGNLVANLLTNL